MQNYGKGEHTMSSITDATKAKIRKLMGTGTSDLSILKKVETLIKNELGKDRPTGARPKMGSKGYGAKPKKKMMGGKVAKKRMYGGSVKKSK